MTVFKNSLWNSWKIEKWALTSSYKLRVSYHWYLLPLNRCTLNRKHPCLLKGCLSRWWMTHLHSFGVWISLTSAIWDWLLDSKGEMSDGSTGPFTFFLRCKPRVSHPLQGYTLFPANVHSALGFLPSALCLMLWCWPPTYKQNVEGFHICWRDTNRPLDLHHCASSFKHSTVILNAKKALIPSGNTPLPYPSLSNSKA